MKSLKLTLSLTAVLLICLSFGKAKNRTPDTQKLSGKYGVCYYENNNLVNYLNLTLNDDQTFYYTDKTNSSKPIETKGIWTQKKNTVVLQDYQSEFPIHSKWKIDPETKCLTSKRGMSFYRICSIAECNK